MGFFSDNEGACGQKAAAKTEERKGKWDEKKMGLILCECWVELWTEVGFVQRQWNQRLRQTLSSRRTVAETGAKSARWGPGICDSDSTG